MKNTTRIIALALVLVMAVMALVSCGNGLEGRWMDDDGMIYEFKGDGTVTATYKGRSQTKNYAVNGNKLTLEGLGTGTFKIEGNTLTLISDDNSIARLTRVK